MALALIGMSGVGKTSWAKKFAAAGYACLHCDDLIADRLRATGDLAGVSVEDVGAWMGFPYSGGYARREARYLQSETEVLRDIALSLPHDSGMRRRLVIDMTGSAIYVDPAILGGIRRSVTMVYLRATSAQHDQLLHAYCAMPRPIVWNGLYQPEPGEEPAAALARCYGQLLEVRAELYESLSHVTLEPATFQNPTATTADFLQAVELARAQTAAPRAASERRTGRIGGRTRRA